MYRSPEYLPGRSGMFVWSRLVAHPNLLQQNSGDISLVAETAPVEETDKEIDLEKVLGV